MFLVKKECTKLSHNTIAYGVLLFESIISWITFLVNCDIQLLARGVRADVLKALH